MRILHITDHTIQFNGMAHAVVDLACAQAKLGYEVAVCRGGGNFGDLLQESGVELFSISRPTKSLSIVKSMKGIYDAIKTFKPDVVHAHMVATAVLARPITWLTGKPLITCVQNSFSRFSPLMRVGDRVITGCQAVADEMAKRGIPKKKLRAILNGTIGSARRPPKIPTPELLQHPAVMTMCGLHPRKGVDHLIKAFEDVLTALPDLHLYVLGEGPYEEQYRKLVSVQHADHIHFCGAVPDPRSYLIAADAFVLASLADPAPLALAEAREAGLATIGTRVDGIPELLENGEAGILIAPGSPAEIASAIRNLFSNFNNLKHWRERSQFQIGRLSVQRVAQETVKVYAECM